MTRLERIANIAIVVACCVVVGSFARNLYLEHKIAAQFKPMFHKGEVLRLSGYTPNGSSEATLVLAISTHCHFCQANAPFYQELSAFNNTAPSHLRLVAVLPEKQNDATGYLSTHSIKPDAVLSMPLAQIGVKGTPTILLLDTNSKIEDYWIGQLDDDQKKEIFGRLKKYCLQCSLPESKM